MCSLNEISGWKEGGRGSGWERAGFTTFLWARVREKTPKKSTPGDIGKNVCSAEARKSPKLLPKARTPRPADSSLLLPFLLSSFSAGAGSLAGEKGKEGRQRRAVEEGRREGGGGLWKPPKDERERWGGGRRRGERVAAKAASSALLFQVFLSSVFVFGGDVDASPAGTLAFLGGWMCYHRAF